MTAVTEQIKSIIKGKDATFKYFRDGALWYQVENSFLFPVPTEDCKGTTLNNVEKAITLMRWIRKEVVDRASDNLK